jgi:hypothetical protein
MAARISGRASTSAGSPPMSTPATWWHVGEPRPQLRLADDDLGEEAAPVELRDGQELGVRLPDQLAAPAGIAVATSLERGASEAAHQADDAADDGSDDGGGRCVHGPATRTGRRGRGGGPCPAAGPLAGRVSCW